MLVSPKQPSCIKIWAPSFTRDRVGGILRKTSWIQKLLHFLKFSFHAHIVTVRKMVSDVIQSSVITISVWRFGRDSGNLGTMEKKKHFKNVTQNLVFSIFRKKNLQVKLYNAMYLVN